MKLAWQYFVALAVLSPASLFAAPADELKALLEQGKAAEAYVFGKKYPEELGNPAFDFHFGIAAIDSGNAGEGVLALERYVVNFPDNATARLELARGYFVLGDEFRSREEFDAVLKTGPPPSVQANIERFLDALRARESNYKTSSGLFLEAGLGYDTNVNGGVGSANITLPVFGGVTIPQTGVKTSDGFTHLAGGGQISVPVAPGLAVFGSGHFDAKLHQNDTTFDQKNIGASGGLAYIRAKDLYRATFSYSTLSVDNARFRDTRGLAGEWHHQLDELQTVNASAQYANLDYTGNNQVRDAKFYGLGAGYRKAFIGTFQPLLSGSVNLAKEDNTERRDDLARDIYGLRVALNITPAAKWALSAGISHQKSDYKAQDPLLLTVRKDAYSAADITASYAVSRNLSVRGELLFSKNNSNLALYEYKRNMLAVKLRYDFR